MCHPYIESATTLPDMFVDLNRTLAIDSPFQTFAVELLVEFIDWLYHFFLQKHFPHRINQGFFIHNTHHLALYVRMDDTITRINASVSIVIQ